MQWIGGCCCTTCSCLSGQCNSFLSGLKLAAYCRLLGVNSWAVQQVASSLGKLKSRVEGGGAGLLPCNVVVAIL